MVYVVSNGTMQKMIILTIWMTGIGYSVQCVRTRPIVWPERCLFPPFTSQLALLRKRFRGGGGEGGKNRLGKIPRKYCLINGNKYEVYLISRKFDLSTGGESFPITDKLPEIVW